MAQGIRGFYKGNCWRLLANIIRGNVSFKIQNFFLYQQYRMQQDRFEPLWLAYCYLSLWVGEAVGFVAMRAESRYILANSQSEWRVQSANQMFRNTFGSPGVGKANLTGGFRGTFALAAINLAAFRSHFERPLDWPFQRHNWVQWIVTYPIITAMRRLQCQSHEPGMIPPRYSGVAHALKLIFNEEGFRGLYRGFGAVTAAHLITFSLVNLTTQPAK